MTNNQKRIIDELIAELRPIVKQSEVTETAVTPTKGYDTLEEVYSVTSVTDLPELPSDYESTGEFRVVRKGDNFLGARHSAVEFPIRVHSYSAAFEGSYRLIVKLVDLEEKVGAAYNVDRIADILIPEGYEAIEFRKLRMGDVFSGATGQNYAVTNKGLFTDKYRMVIRPISAPKPPTVFDIYGTHDLSTITIPEGYVSVGFQALKAGESFISADGGRVLKSSMVHVNHASPHANLDGLFTGRYRLVVEKAPLVPTMMEPALREKIDLPATNTAWAALENILATNVKDYGIDAVLIALANVFDKKARETAGPLSGSMNNTAQQLSGLAARMSGRFKKEGQV